jgi:hypothetical protein
MSGYESDDQFGNAKELSSMKALDEMGLESIRLPLLCNNARACHDYLFIFRERNLNVEGGFSDYVRSCNISRLVGR